MDISADEMNEIMQNQPIVNIGMIGGVSHGKSTIVLKMTNVVTQKYASEKIQNITIKLGYANAKIFKCNTCESPTCYKSTDSSKRTLLCDHCDNQMELITHISCVDCPGHHALMATMLNGTCVMDYTILVESLQNAKMPVQQTKEHIIATTLTDTPNKIVCINKVDLVKRDVASAKIQELQNELKGTIAEKSKIVPISATFGINIDVLCQYISEIPIPKRKLDVPCKMIVIRSFNVNKPGIKINDLLGGVIGGSIVEGKIELNDDIILLPGYVEKITEENKVSDASEKRWQYTPLRSKILSLNSDKNKLTKAIPGGLIGIQLDIDPALTAEDGLIGNIMIHEKSENDYCVYEDIMIEFTPYPGKEDIKINKGDILTMNINACNNECTVMKYKKNILGLQLNTHPICAKIGSQVTISFKDATGSLSIYGCGIITLGNTCIQSNRYIKT
jgi:translation initiation factor 2 subunit 3